jgi:SAM-dependent methyltransferase
MGCGTGFQTLQFARQFPRSRFTGVDLNPVSIRHAQEKALAQQGMELGPGGRVDFIVADLTSLDAGWTDRFDLVLDFDACHDLKRADLVASFLILYHKIKMKKLILINENMVSYL